MERQNRQLNISARSFLTAILVIAVLMIVTYGLTFWVPGGSYARLDDGTLDPASFVAAEGGLPLWTQVHPGINIVPIDYDLSATKVNQENRIRLMLAVAGDALKKRQQQELLIAQDEAAAKSCGGDCEGCRKNAG